MINSTFFLCSCSSNSATPVKPTGSVSNSVIAIRIGYPERDFRSLPFLIAEGKGMIKAQGITDVQSSAFPDSSKIVDKLSKGKLDAGYVCPVAALSAVASGRAKIKMVAQICTGGVGMIVRDQELHSPLELAEEDVAVPGKATIERIWLYHSFVQYHLDGRVYVIEFPSAQMEEALIEKRLVEGFIAFEPLPAAVAAKENAGYIDFSKNNWRDYHSGCLVVSESFLSNHPKLVEKLVRAHSEATKWINEHPEPAVTAAVNFYEISNPVAVKAFKNISYATEPPIESLQKTAAYLPRFGIVSKYNPFELIDKFVLKH